MNHKIVLPNVEFFREYYAQCPHDIRPKNMSRVYPRIFHTTRCLWCLPSYRDDVSVEVDDGTMLKSIPPLILMDNDNGCYPGFFKVDDELFMVVDCDRPYTEYKRWVPYYEEHGVKAYFVSAKRKSYDLIFDKCSIPAFSLPGKPGIFLDYKFLECDALSQILTTPKDIPVFYQCRFGTRIARLGSGMQIQKHIPGSHVQNTNPGWAPRGGWPKDLKIGKLPREEYADLLSRSKISWCPRSVWSKPDKDSNAPLTREFESMCMAALVLKHSIGTTETEERHDGVHFVEIKNDDSDLIEKINYYLEHEEERIEIAHNGRMYFERNCTISARAHKIFDDALSAI